MRLGRRLSTGIAEDPPVPAEVSEPVAALDVPGAPQAAVPEPRPARTPDPAVSGG
ncbi:hypothetical protein [Actinomycetospora atypica]|uniref:Uncharacterized protein n=1 Tax=Actinomycetospora atypica TaxID=1290095 RepID=A0ABV9YUK9_9PSEU